MAYTKHSWVEFAGTTGGGGDRETWLNNMETQYDEMVSYYTATLHDDLYYTQAECDAKYFKQTGDGTGSGIVAETLDGYTSAQLIASSVPAGTIAIWAGAQVDIPTGWHLCDGRDANTPALRDRMPIGAGGSLNKGDMGGASMVQSTAASITLGATTLTTSQIPAHAHTSITDYYNNNLGANDGNYGSAQTGTQTDYSSYTGYTGGGGSHNHTATMTGDSTAGNNMPPYMALCYIVKE
jgi:microcystin-dependent protein